MTKMTAKKALLTSILSLLVSVTMLVGTTFAWFTDSVTSGTNRIIAGNLDVEVYHTSASVATAETVEGKTNLFRNDDGEAMLWEPGAVSYENLTVKNIGTLAFKYAINMNVTDYNAVSGTDKTLLDVLKVKILKGEDIITAIDRASILALNWSADDVQTLGEFTDSDELYPVGNVPTGEASEKAFQIIVYWQPTANDNDYNLNNGKTSTDQTPLFIEFGINLVAAQFTYEEDSFGNDYDDGTSLPALPVTINKTFKSAAVNHNDTLDPNETVKIVNAKNVTVAELEPTSAQAIIDQVNTIITDKDPEKDVNTVFTLSIETTEVKEDSVTYEIDLNAVTTYTTNSDVTATKTLTKEQVNTALAAADELVVAEVNIGAGLHDVTVKHSGVAMSPLASASEEAVGYYYDITTGKLTIKTKSFSPFTIAYRTEYAAKVGETYYMSAEDAFKAATASDTVVFLSDCKVNLSKIPTEKNFDLNGKTIDLGSKGKVSSFDGNSTALKYFAGGYGTEEKPFLISNRTELERITSFWGKYSFYKWDGAATLDASDWTKQIYLCGSFDGNGLVINNLDHPLFNSVWNGSDSWDPAEDTVNVYAIKNITANINIVTDGWTAGIVRIVGVHNFLMEGVTVHGYIEGAQGVASFICFGAGNYHSATWTYDGNVTFKNCNSDATIVSKSGNAVGFISHAMTATTAANVSLINSNFTGNLSCASCKYICGNWINATITDDQSATKNNVVYKTSDNGWTYIAEGKTGSFTVTSGSLPANIGDVFEIDANANATKAVISLVVSPNPGCFTSTYATEEVTVVDGKITSETIKYFIIRINGEGITEEGINGNYFDIVNDIFNGELGTDTYVRITQYNEAGSILSITNISFNDK